MRSFESYGDETTDNSILKEDKLLADIYGISIHPTITINGQIYKGDLTGNDIFRAVCASFTSEFRPYECLQEFNLVKELG